MLHKIKQLGQKNGSNEDVRVVEPRGQRSITRTMHRDYVELCRAMLLLLAILTN